MNPNVLITAAAAVLPSLLLIWYFYSRDENPEPGSVVLTTFFLGVLIVVPVVIVALPALFFLVPVLADTLAVPGSEAHMVSEGVSTAFLSAAVPEEFFKWLVVVFYCARHKEFDEPMDGIVYGVAASLGFATLENVLYVLQGGLGLAVARAVTAVPCHAFLGAIMGYYVARARFALGAKGPLYLLSLLIPMALHGLYDFPLMVLNVPHPEVGGDKNPLLLVWIGVALAVLVLMAVWTFTAVRILHTEQLKLRAAGGILPEVGQ